MKKSITAKPKKLSIALEAKASTYDKDFYKWTKSQVGLLQKKDFTKLDIDNLIEEIDSLGKSDKRALLSHFIILLLHRLKMEYQLTHYSKSWDDSIENATVQIDLIIEDSPSLKRELPTLFEKAYAYARKKAAIETNLKASTFPIACPWKLEDVLGIKGKYP